MVGNIFTIKNLSEREATVCVSVCRAAAYSKLGNYAGAVQDCERAIRIDPNYSKAYGRMGYVATSSSSVIVVVK